MDEENLDTFDDELEDETEFAAVATGATIAEAKKNALEGLRKVAAYVSESDVEFVTIEEGHKGGIFGIGKAQPRVEARLRSAAERPSAERPDPELSPAADLLQTYLEDVLMRMSIKATVSASATTEVVSAAIAGEDLGILIGRHGQTLDALQYLAAIHVNKGRRERLQIVVDAEGYRKRRAAALTALAERSAQKVARDDIEVTLDPMSAGERKIVHLCLKDDPRVETTSEGQEPNRAVIILPKRHED